jgi:hypothetical protein
MKKGPSMLVRFTLYPVVAILFVALASFMLLLSFGYKVNYADGKFTTTKTGIIIIASNPGDAEVYLNGDLHRKKTSALSFINLKINRLPAGEYSVRVEKEDYIPWEGKITVNPGFVSWLNYLYLVPLEKNEQPYNLPGEVSKVITSNDKNISLVSSIDKKSNIQTLWKIETSSKNKSKIFEADLKISNPIEPISISFDNNRFLYREKNKNEKIILKARETRDNGRSWNITEQFNVEFNSIGFSPYSNEDLYGLRDENLYKVNYAQRRMSASLARDVVGIYPNNSQMLLVQNTDSNYGLWKIEQNDEIKNVIKALPSSTKYNVEFVREENYYLVHISDEKDLVLYTNGVRNPTLETISKNAISFRVSPDGKKVAIKTENNLLVYDLSDRNYFEIASEGKIKMVDWFSDSYNLIYKTDTELRLVNYNGYYNQTLVKPNKELPAIISSSNNHIYYCKNINDKNDLFVISF